MQRHQRMENRQQHSSKVQQHRRTVMHEDEENSTNSTDEDIYDRIAILAKEYGEDYEDDEDEEDSSLTMRRNYNPKHNYIPEDTPTSETNDPFSDDKEDSEDQQEIQMKVQTRKALKDSKKFLHTTRKMENKMNISHNQSVLSNALSKEKNDLYEATINQITSKENWILSTSFDKCFEKIRKQVMSDVFSREKSKNRSMDPYSNSRKPNIKTTTQASKGKTIEKKPNSTQQPYDDTPLPTNNRKNNYDDIPIRKPKQQQQVETQVEIQPQKKKQQEQPLIQKDKSRRQSKQKTINIEPYEATESELNALEGFFGSKKTLNIVNVGSVFVRIQKFWRANRKYNRNRTVIELREMWRTTVFEMERAQYERLDTSEYKRQLKYFAAQFCKEMNPQKPFTPGGKKTSAKDKHTFLHRKQQPAFLKNVNKRKSNSKSSTPATPPDTPTQPTPTNISPPSNSFATPLRSPPTRPREEVEQFTPPISQSPRKDFQQKRHTVGDEEQFTTPKKSNGMRRSLSSRVFRLETRANVENTPLSEQEATPFKEGQELNMTSNSEVSLQQTLNNFKSSPRNSPRKMTPQKQVSSPINTTLPEQNNSSISEENNFSTPTKSETKELNQNSLNNITVSPIMRKAPPPPIEVQFSNNDRFNEQDDPYEEEEEMDNYDDNYSQHSDSFMEDEEFDGENSALMEELENLHEKSVNDSPKKNIEKIEEQALKTIEEAPLNNSKNQIENSISNNVENRFSQSFREEEDKKKAEALYNRTTGTLSGLLSPRGRQSTEILNQNATPKQPEEEQKPLDAKNMERKPSLIVEESNLSISSQESSPETIPKPPSRKPPQPTLSLEEYMERDRTRFEELENLCFSVDESSIIYQFDKEFVYNGLL